MTKRKDPSQLKRSGRPKIDIAGERFGALVVLREDGRFDDGVIAWLCRCDCGKEFRTRSSTLRNAGAYSCGCLGKAHTTEVATKHGKHGDVVYKTWQSMLFRCQSPSAKGYKNYGGRGISVCERWRDFVAFYEDMGDPPPGTSIDRIDNNGNYEPSNCRWATVTEQARNRRTNKILSFRGKEKCIVEWAEDLGLTVNAIRNRLRVGWSVEQALSTPLRGRE